MHECDVHTLCGDFNYFITSIFLIYFVQIAVATNELHCLSQKEDYAYIRCEHLNYFNISKFISYFVQIAVATNELHRLSQEEDDAYIMCGDLFTLFYQYLYYILSRLQSPPMSYMVYLRNRVMATSYVESLITLLSHYLYDILSRLQSPPMSYIAYLRRMVVLISYVETLTPHPVTLVTQCYRPVSWPVTWWSNIRMATISTIIG